MVARVLFLCAPSPLLVPLTMGDASVSSPHPHHPRPYGSDPSSTSQHLLVRAPLLPHRYAIPPSNNLPMQDITTPTCPEQWQRYVQGWGYKTVLAAG
jgi:hypothetical protein